MLGCRRTFCNWRVCRHTCVCCVALCVLASHLAAFNAYPILPSGVCTSKPPSLTTFPCILPASTPGLAAASGSAARPCMQTCAHILRTSVHSHAVLAPHCPAAYDAWSTLPSSLSASPTPTITTSPCILLRPTTGMVAPTAPAWQQHQVQQQG
jgi:hypothetical protein